MDIIQKNKIIAEFMGGTRHINEGWLMPNVIGLPKDTQLQYHTSWDWLMPVVEKVEDLFDGSISVHIYDGRCYIEISTQYAIATDIYLPDSNFYNNQGGKLNSVWNSVVSFIQWYNQLKNQQSCKPN